VVKPYKRPGREFYYFKVSINNKMYSESTRETDYRKAMKVAVERERELRGIQSYYEPLNRLISCIDSLAPEERDKARNICVEKLTEGTILKVSLDEAFEQYRNRPKKREATERTYRDQKRLWNKFVQWAKKAYPQVKFLNEVHIEVAEDFLISEWKKHISERTYNERIKNFRAIFTALSKKAGLRENVWTLVEKKTENTISKENLTSEHLNQLFSCTDRGEMKALFMIGVYTGLRLGDAATLKWSEINFDTGIITKQPSKTKGTGKKIHLPIHIKLKEMLLLLKKEADENNKNDYVLPKYSRLHINSPTYLSKLVQTAFKKAGIETSVERDGTSRKTAVYGFHSFRHTFVSMCAAENIPVHVVMELVGHNSKLVHQVYQHASNAQKVKAIKSLPDFTF